MSSRFPIDGVRVRQLAATRQGRVSLGGFAYQIGYSVARLASLYTRRPVLEIDGFPTLLRFDWAEDLDEVEADGSVVLTQCKRISDIGQAGTLADVLLGFAPKWLWTPEDRRPALRFRLVCSDPRFAGLGFTSLRSYRPRPGESDRDAVLGAAIAQLQISPGSKSDRALWQSEAEMLGLSRLCESLWEQTEVLYLPAEIVPDDPAGPLFRAERDALALLVRMQSVAVGQQRPALAALRTLLHANVVEFEPNGTRSVPALDREPLVLDFDDIHYALFDFQPLSEERPPFQVVTRQVLEGEAAKPKQPFVARRPSWSDVVHGQNEEIRFLEREITDHVLAIIRDELLGKIGAGEALPMLFLLGAPGAGKSTLALRVAARLVQEGLAVVAAPKLNLESIEADEVEPFIQALARLEEGSLPVLLLLDDPFFAESGWVNLFRRLGKKSRRMIVLGASPEYLFREFGYALTTGRQIDCRTLVLPRPLRTERRALARLHGRDPEAFAERDEDLLVLVMEASAGVSFDTIIDRIWITLNRGLPIDPTLHPEDLPWTVRAYLVACYFHRFYLRCPEILMLAIMSQSGQDQPSGRIEYELRRLFDEHGWSIFGLVEPEVGQRFLGVRIGATHARVAVEAWRRRPVPAFDVGEWLVNASLHAQGAAMEIGNLAVHLEREKRVGEVGFLKNLVSLWNHAAKIGELETSGLCFLHSALLSQGVPSQASNLRPGLEACFARKDGQSWLAVLALIRQPGSRFTEQKYLSDNTDLLSLIRVADFHLATTRAGKFLNIFKNDLDIYEAVINKFMEIDLDHPRTYALLTPLVASNPRNEAVHKRVTDWIGSKNPPQAYHLLEALVAASPGDESVRTLVINWITQNQDHPQAYHVLAPLLAARPGDEAVRKRAMDWLESNLHHPQLYWILASLVAANPGDEAVRKRAENWIESNLHHPQVPQLLAPLVAGSPGDEALRRKATDWIALNQYHLQAYHVLASLVAANPGDEAVLKLATDWIDLKPNHSQVSQLLAPLVAANPEDEVVRKRATDWIEANFERGEAINLLPTLIARSGGAEDFLRLGEKFLSNPLRFGRSIILGVLLTAGKAAAKYIDLAFDYLDDEDYHKARYFVLNQLSRAAVTNLSTALAYIAECGDESRKRTLLRSIAIGIQRRPQTLEALLDGRMEALSFEDANALLTRLLDQGVATEELLRFIGLRMANQFRLKGYGFLRRAVQRNPTAQEGILALPDLDPRVRVDLSSLA